MNEESNERMNKSTIEKEEDLDLEVLQMNLKKFNSVIRMDDVFQMSVFPLPC